MILRSDRGSLLALDLEGARPAADQPDPEQAESGLGSGLGQLVPFDESIAAAESAVQPVFTLAAEEETDAEDDRESDAGSAEEAETSLPCEACGAQDGMPDPGNPDKCLDVKNGRDMYCRVVKILFFNGVPWSVPNLKLASSALTFLFVSLLCHTVVR